MTDEQRAAFEEVCRRHSTEWGTMKMAEALFMGGIAYAQAWRPMESALRDGTDVLLNIAGIERRIGRWDDDYRGWESGRSTVYPTGWLPLPGSGK